MASDICRPPGDKCGQICNLSRLKVQFKQISIIHLLPFLKIQCILNPWLRNIRDVYRIHANELDAIKDEGARYNRLVELNVQEQCVNVIKTATVQRAYRDRGLTVHGWVFDLNNGQLVDLKIDFPHILEKIMEIYHLD